MKRLTYLLLIAVAGAAGAQVSNVVATASIHDALQLTTATPSVTHSFPVDSTTLLGVTLIAPSRTLSVTLQSPVGVRYVIGTPAAGFSSVVMPLDTTSTRTGAAYRCFITNPPTGTWSLTAAEQQPPATPVDAVITILMNNQVRVVIGGGGDSYPLASNIRLAFVAFDHANKLTGLTLTGRMFRPGDPTFSPVTVTFRDDGTGGDETGGDRIYETFVNPGQVGSYQVQVDVTGTASTGPFRRTATTEFRVVARDAQIINVIDQGVDDDGDGLVDRIVITPAATINKAGLYSVSVRLHASNGKEILRSADQTLSVGTGAVAVSFSASDILRDVGVGGPYDIAEVRYLEHVNGEVLPADVRYDLGQTSAYDLSGLQHSRLRLSGANSASGVDTNGNHLFDALHVVIGLVADFGGSYTGSFSLTDASGYELGFASGTVSLVAGQNTVSVDFPGQPIGHHGVDGPYYVSNLIFFGEDASLVASTAYTTAAFHASEFEGYVVSRRRAVHH